MKKILILAANPTDTTQLRLGDEVRKIQNARRQATNRQDIQIFSQWVRVDDLRQVLFEHKPNVVHFCGHGEGDDGLVLENEYGEKQLVSSESLAGLFKNFQEYVDCVVLNACYSEVQGEAIHEHINCVIGMNQSISDKAAIEFATGFYEALTNGANYQDSFEFGKNALDLKNIPESQTPQIKIKDISTSLLDPDAIDSQPKQRSDFKPIKYIPKFGNPNFVGRGDELVKIHDKFSETNSKVVISSVSGMGGVGKTELAIQYARKYEDDYPGGICWLNVRDTNLAAEIIQFIQLQMGLEVPQKDFQENLLTLEEQVDWCWRNWKPPEGSVLLVLDDVTEYKDIKRFLPRTENQRFKLLITTRQRRLDTNLVDIPLDVLSEDEALSLLRGILGEKDKRIERELETTKYLCKWLGNLPLGLELVGRYLEEDGDLSIAEILEELKEERLEYEAINPESEDLEENTEMTARLGVQAAFNLTWEKLDSKTREVGELLSLFNPNEIAWEYVESVSESLSWKKKDVRNAKKLLYGRNVIKRLEEGEASYQVHPLIRKFLQDKLKASPQVNELKQAFASTLIEIGQTIPENATLEFLNSVKNAIPHLEEVIENHLDAVSDENLYSAFLGLGKFYEGKGLYNLAEPWFEQSVSIVRERLRENHPDTATSLNDLAILYKNQGKYDEAQPLYIQALQLRKQLFGENHPDVAQSLNHLAILYFQQGKYDRAQPLYIQALQLRKQLLGENHPDVAGSFNDLAVLYKNQGKYEQAEPLYIQALELRKQLFGENHPQTTDVLNNLALLYCEQGRYDEAEPLYIQALELTKQLLGENHPHTARSLNNLACQYSDQGRYDEAEPLYIQALELYKQRLGENHPDTATSLNNLACNYSDMKRYDEAEPLFIKALELRKQLLGKNHPYTAASLNNLAFHYSDMKRYDEAEPLFIKALKLRKQLLGKNHPHTAASLNNLAKLYNNQGRYDEAEPLFIQALELRKQLLTENHPNTANSLNNLALLYSRQRRYDEAEPLFIQAVEIAERVLGESHPNTVKYRGDLEDFRVQQRESGNQ